MFSNTASVKHHKEYSGVLICMDRPVQLATKTGPATRRRSARRGTASTLEAAPRGTAFVASVSSFHKNITKNYYQRENTKTDPSGCGLNWVDLHNESAWAVGQMYLAEAEGKMGNKVETQVKDNPT